MSKILEALQLEQIKEDTFEGKSRDLGTPQVYGGQVLGQALEAARRTLEDREVHSVHAYFLRRGDFDIPIIYQVDRNRDGGSFTARRVVASQHGKPIFTLSASFQKQETGLDHYESITMPATPDQLTEMGLLTPDSGRHAIRLLASDFDAYRVEPDPENKTTSLRWWVKTHDSLPNEQSAHNTILAYISDFGLLMAAVTPHAPSIEERKALWSNMLFASIDHAIWFHRPFRADEWLLYDCNPVSTSNSRGCARGSFYDTRGVLVATTFQEGLTRLKNPS